MFSLVSVGHNNDFYKGDAFFSSFWKLGMFEKKTESILLRYERLSLQSMNCGSGGVSDLVVDKLPKKFGDNLKKVDQMLCESFKDSRLRELRLFVYNKDYDFKKWGLAYKYNENWVEQQVEVEDLGHAKYDQLGGSRRIIQDWRGAESVAGLDVNELKDKRFSGDFDPFGDFPEVTRYLQGNGGDYAFVVVVSNTISYMMDKTYCECIIDTHNEKEEVYKEAVKILKEMRGYEKQMLKFYVITDKIRLFEEQKEGKWKVTEVLKK